MLGYWLGCGVVAGLAPTLLAAAMDWDEAFVRGELLLLAWGLGLTGWADATLRGAPLPTPYHTYADLAFTVAAVSVFVYVVLQVYRFLGGRPSRTWALAISLLMYIGALLCSAGCVGLGAR